MGWFKCLNYAGTFQYLHYVEGNNDDYLCGANVNTASGLITGDIPAVSAIQTILSGSSQQWVFIAMVERHTGTRGVDFYYRLEEEATLHTFTLADPGLAGPHQMNLLNAVNFNPGTYHCRCSKYKEWSLPTAMGATAAQIAAAILIESGQTAPGITAGLTSYLSCANGSVVGTSQGGTGGNWAVTATVATNADEPNINLPTYFGD